jgi:predicted RNA binding protein YcfA (HicA-like mRNA interferase family)
MSKFQKAVDRMLSKPKDFTWQELQTVLGKLGYKEHAGQGSRRKFVHEKIKHVISFMNLIRDQY